MRRARRHDEQRSLVGTGRSLRSAIKSARGRERSLPVLRHVERGRPQVLRRVRKPACADVSLLWDAERTRREVLRRVRDGTGRGRKIGAARATGGRAAPRLRPLCRPRRLHVRVGGPRRGGHARASLPLLRHLPAADRALRRHRREVHRRCRHGRLGDADRHGGRRGASGARRSRPRRCRVRLGRRGRSSRAAGARRRAHRRGGYHDRRGRPGDGRRRSRQHRLAGAVGRRPGDGARRRIDAARDGADDRLRRGRVLRAQGEGRTHPALESAARRLRIAWLPQVAGPRGALRRARSRAAPDQGSLPHHGRGAQGAPRLRDRHRRHREVAPRVGVLQVLRRHRGDGLLAPWALPLLRRGRDVLGARRHGAHAVPHRRGRGALVRPSQAARHARGAHPRRRGA